MCRLLGYLGPAVELDRLLTKPEHSLVVQSYQPREMTAGLLNADGFGIGWYHPQKVTAPFTYKNTQPIWSDVNLPSLTRYIESGCVLANVRSATAGQAVDLSNCQPFQHRLILGIHNGFIANFRETLYRPIRDRLSDRAYQAIGGSTDSEHLFALVIHELEVSPGLPLAEALRRALVILDTLAADQAVSFAANLVFSDGQQLVASRFSRRSAVPSLYWLRDDPLLPQAVLIASEPLFPGNWTPFPEHSLLMVHHDLNIQIQPLSIHSC
ncbi:ergothioneine biosynthesis protein EgtC [Leptothermofonsia sichuanensis E412]|uniref:ergothioneine biosynthesis protein EgtC n=1 Tax=Leptothermofonsia sichuanensis TaxID=2917832 RepID=UPI001CA741EA|nr:ergothioneine biosynthesis protein EgtC [Leptothermofonsia sichuanensis]QZZ19867.1 ergothioneine biosynthesis protein EgtC [Leptothermofonsia sichuanensis E412]